MVLLLLFLIPFIYVSESAFSAGVSKVDGTLPIGVPLAGYNHGGRRVKSYPKPIFTEYSTWLNPSVGILNPTWVKALVIDDGFERICMVTLDTLCADESLQYLSWVLAKVDGFTIPLEKVTFSGSHTHSGPGGWNPGFGIQVAPTFDMFVPELQRMFASKIAQAMVAAEKNLQPAAIAFGVTEQWNVTVNRRAGFSPYVNSSSIDPYLSMIRVDDLKGNPLATLWNFAIHGVCYSDSNLFYSSDIMGTACDSIEKQVGGIALFVNADAGDISPDHSWACNNGPNFDGGLTLANTAVSLRNTLKTTTQGKIKTASNVVDFGFPIWNVTLARDYNCTEGGPLDICTICEILGCEIDLPGGPFLVEEKPRFTAFGFQINGESVLLVTQPGEALQELGFDIRNDATALGFNKTLLFGYSNNYLMYFCPEREYVLGGYECTITLWGINTSDYVREGSKSVAAQVIF